MSGFSKSELMYEKYLRTQDGFVPLKCEECKKILCYTYGDFEGVIDCSDSVVFCPKCKELLPE